MTTFRAPIIGVDAKLDVTLTERTDLVSSGGTANVVVGDASVVRNSNSVTKNEFEFVANAWQYSASNFEDVTVDCTANGVVVGNHVQRLSNGPVDIFFRAPWITKKYSRQLLQTPANTVDIFQSWVNGSLVKHMAEQQTSRITGGSQKEIFSSFNAVANTYVRNVNCWPGLDLTCIPAWNDLSGWFGGGVAISPRHIAMVTHYPFTVGSVLTFVTAGNVSVSRTITALANVVSGSNPAHTITIGLLDSDLPATIVPAKVLPANYRDYLPSLGVFSMPIALGCNYVKQLFPRDVMPTQPNLDIIGLEVATDVLRAPLTSGVISGDSGSPIFFALEDKLVLASMWGTAYTGPMISRFISAINASMTVLGGGYQLTQANITSYFGPAKNQVRGFTDANYYKASVDAGLAKLGTARIVVKLLAFPIPGNEVFAGRTDETGVNGGWYFGASPNQIFATQRTSTGNVLSPAHTIVSGDVGRVFVIHAKYDAGVLRMFIDGVEVGSGTAGGSALSARPIDFFTVGKLPTLGGYALSSWSIIDIATSNAVMSNAQILADATTINATSTNKIIPTLPSEADRFSAEDLASATNWVSRTGSLTATRTGSLTVDPY